MSAVWHVRLAMLGALLAPLLLTACAPPPRTVELGAIDQRVGYRYVTLNGRAPKTIDRTGVIVTFSGGGTRAAALADGALQALAATTVMGGKGPVTLATQIDVISSVSGGSVTAAYFGFAGVKGLGDLENKFLDQDVMGAIIGRALLNPTRLLHPRIELLEDYLDDSLFGGKTFGDMMTVDKPEDRRPLVVLNATDMATGGAFAFTQDQFDLMCADLAALKIASAVSASAAFPGALNALTLKNFSPCTAQRKAADDPHSGWKENPDDGNSPEPVRIVDDRDVEVRDGVAYPSAQNLSRNRRGRVDLTYLNRDNDRQYVQLLDGGLADNLGLTHPITLMTSSSESPSFLSWTNNSGSSHIDKLLLLVVNARGDAANDYGTRAGPPGIIDTLLTTIGTPIDATSFQMLDQLDLLRDPRLNPRSVVLVDFDFIADRACRQAFQNMATSWTLPKAQVAALIHMGEAMVLQSPQYKDLVTALGGTVPTPGPGVDEICRDLKTSG